MQVLIYERSFPRICQRLEQKLPEVQPLLMANDGSLTLDGQRIALDAARPVAAWANSDLYAGGPVRDFMVACLKSGSLRFIQSSAAGFDHPVFSMLVDKGIALATSDASAVAIAEFVMAAVLSEYQPQPLRRQLQRERAWQRVRFREIAGTTWLVIGVGNIGSEVAKRARAFAAHVIGVRRNPRGDEPVDRMCKPSALAAVIPEADVVVLCAPANRESRYLVDAGFLARMKPESLLVNVSRGALLDERALVASLIRGIPECAILDVFENEPLSPDSPLWDNPRVRVSAHDSANGSGFIDRGDAVFLRNLQRFARGEPLLHLADPAVVKQSGAAGG
jgi:phosphoglycerate dehydrogenase-like enzyme